MASTKRYAAFLSHYKEEAGQAATIINLMLESSPDLAESSGMFLDSNDLQDLYKLLDSVRQSQCLIVILTKHYFSRPYCIAELVEAYRSDVPMVSCMLAGIPAAFDPKQFSQIINNYENMLNESGWEVVVEHNITKEDARDAVKRLSKVIARDFSPHAHKKIRRAQIDIIVDDLSIVIDSVGKAHAKAPRSKIMNPYKDLWKLEAGDPGWARYRDMKDAGVPDGAIKNNMKRDGIDPTCFHSMNATGDPSAAVLSTQWVLEWSEQLQRNYYVNKQTGEISFSRPGKIMKPYRGLRQLTAGDPEWARYREMRDAGVPEAAIKNNMQRDGVDPTCFHLMKSAGSS